MEHQPRRLRPRPLRPLRAAQPASPLWPRLSGLPSRRRSAGRELLFRRIRTLARSPPALQFRPHLSALSLLRRSADRRSACQCRETMRRPRRSTGALNGERGPAVDETRSCCVAAALRFAHEKVLGGNRFFVVFAGTDRRAGTLIVSLTIWNTNRVHISQRTLVGFEMARDRFGEIVLRKDPRDSFSHVGTDRAAVTKDLWQRDRKRRRRGGGVRCCGTSTGSETQAGKARRTAAAGESRKKGWLSACGSIS